MSQDSTFRERALNYLKAGASQEQTAKALGVEPSTISYYLQSDPAFAEEVATADLVRRQKHNRTDELADELEADLLERLKEASQGLYRPMELAKVYALVNKAVRRGTSAPAGITNNNQQIVNISLPPAILGRIKMNRQSQIVSAGQQELITLQSGQMKSLAERTIIAKRVGDILEKHHASEGSHNHSAILPVPARPNNDTIPAPTINGLTQAEQAIRRINAGGVKTKDASAEDLGFG